MAARIRGRLNTLKRGRALLALGTAGAILTTGLVAGPGARPSSASNHIDAVGQIADRQLDVADNYFFTSPDNSDMVTAICDWSAFELPIVDGILPFYQFVTQGHYDFNFDNSGDGKPDFTFRFDFDNTNGFPDPKPAKGAMPPELADLLPKGQQSWQNPPSLDASLLEQLDELPDGAALRKARAAYVKRARAADQADQAARRGKAAGAQRGSGQTYTLELVRPGKPTKVLARNVPSAPYGRDDRHKSVATWSDEGGGKAFAGPVSDPFFWWLPTNVHSIGLQLPKKLLALNNDPSANPVVGMSTAAYRESFDLRTGQKKDAQHARQGLSGFSSVVLPVQMRDYYHAHSSPATDHTWKDMQAWVKTGATGSLFGVAFLPVTGLINIGRQLEQMFLYGIAKSNGPIKHDLNAHILNRDAVPAEIKPSDQMRLNLTTPLAKWNRRHGLLDGDLQGYPNGRRLTDDVFTAFARITVGEPAFSTPLGVISVIPVSGVPFTPREFPYQNPPW